MSHPKWTSQFRAVVFWLAPLLILTACGDDGPTGPGQGEYYISASINGQSWNALSNQIVAGPSSAIPGSIFFQGASLGNPGHAVAIALGRITGPGQYPLGMNPGTGSGGIVTYTSGAQAFTTPLTGAAGSITISEISSDAVTGTFQLTATPLVGDEAPVSITNGRFHVPLSSGFEVAPPEERGNLISLTFGGAATGQFVGGTVAAAGEPGTLMTFSGTNQTYTVIVALSSVSAVGTVPLQNTLPIRRISVQPSSGTGVWGNNPNDSGTITVTSVTGGRIQGTFTGTLAPSQGAVGNLQVTNGQFDIMIP